MTNILSELHTWVINLDQDKERLESISQKLNMLGLVWTRISAIAGKNLSPAEQARGLDRLSFMRLHGMRPSLGELGCYLSHIEAMKAFLASQFQFALILEDDAGPHPDLIPALATLLQRSGHWDMVKLSGVHRGTPVKICPLGDERHLAVMLTGAMGSSAYVINRLSAQRYLDRLLPMKLPYDHAFERGWVFDLRIRRVVPWVVDHDTGAETTIVSIGPARKFHWIRRLPTFAYRIGRDLRRLLSGVKQLLQANKNS